MTNDERRHLGRVAALGCMVCRRLYGPHDPGPVEIHHKRAGTGAGRRASHFEAFGLCVSHHRGNLGVHGLGTKGFAKYYGFDEDDLLADVKTLLG